MRPDAGGFDPDSVELVSGSLIGGARVISDGAETRVMRPSDGRLAKIERGASAAVVDQAVRLAEETFRTSDWKSRAPRDRARVLMRWAALVDTHAEELARLESTVSVRVVGSVRSRDVPMSAEIIRFYAEYLDKVEGSVLATSSDKLSLLVREPYGVVATISPWNTPMLLAIVKIAPAIAAGNAVVLKPSELTAYATLRIAELAVEAGVPPGIIAVLPGVGAETGRALVRHPRVNYVGFTGSGATGAQVMCDAANSGLKPVSLELGGKSPQVVFADAADLERVADIVAQSVCANGGQVCFAGTRLVVEESIAERMIAAIDARMGRVRVGATWEPHTTLAPIVSEAQAQRLEALVHSAREAGADLLRGGSRLPGGPGGIFYTPTILKSTHADNPAVLDELFGPVLTVQTFKDFDEAMRLADHPRYGLAAGVFTTDLGKALRAAHTIQAGTVWVNQFGPNIDPNAPMGGYKQSGFGKDFGLAGLDKFLKTKNIAVQF